MFDTCHRKPLNCLNSDFLKYKRAFVAWPNTDSRITICHEFYISSNDIYEQMTALPGSSICLFLWVYFTQLKIYNLYVSKQIQENLRFSIHRWPELLMLICWMSRNRIRVESALKHKEIPWSMLPKWSLSKSRAITSYSSQQFGTLNSLLLVP